MKKIKIFNIQFHFIRVNILFQLLYILGILIKFGAYFFPFDIIVFCL